MIESLPDEGFVELLEYLRDTRGFDFTGYKPSSLMRRIQKRMQMLNIYGFPQYQDHLEVHPEEFEDLFNFVLINVTSFFRDPAIWDYVANEIVPVIAERAGHRQIRIWDAGCASGEEAYTLAMLFAEHLGKEMFGDTVKIYATDVDEHALAEARAASYPLSKLDGIPEGLSERYFEPVGADRLHVFDKDLRRSVIFGRHNLVQDAPISRIDLLACRNTLMYLNAETQAKVLTNFHFALSEDGFLLLGKAEMLFTKGKSFVPVDLKRRIFRKIPGGENRARLLLSPNANNHVDMSLDATAASPVFEASPLAQLIINGDGVLVGANPRAQHLFRMQNGDVGRPIRELEVSYRPVELAGPLQEVWSQRSGVRMGENEFAGGPSDVTHVSVEFTPLLQGRGDVMGVLVSYTDISRPKKLEHELQATGQELETALEELQSTNEELETTNEELQSTNEELETTNEELQSTNEELETMNEELESTNEELQAVNQEARRRTDELDEASSFMESILGGLGSAVVVVDTDLRVSMWNRAAEDMWGVRSEEARREPLIRLDIGLPVDKLMATLRHCLSGASAREQTEVRATNRRGRKIRCLVSCSPLMGSGDKVQGAILLMEDQTPVRASVGAADPERGSEGVEA